MPSNGEVAIQRAKADLEAAKRSGNQRAVDDAKRKADAAYEAYATDLANHGQAGTKSKSWFGL